MSQEKLIKILCGFLLITTSCKKQLPGLELNKEFTLRYDQTAIVADKLTGQNITIKFEEVIVDSRCPMGATCIWAGEVIIELLLDKKIR